jgi:hypothetical protein
MAGLALTPLDLAKYVEDQLRRLAWLGVPREQAIGVLAVQWHVAEERLRELLDHVAITP